MNSQPLQGSKPRVLFVNTRSALGADVAVHLTLIQNFDPAQVEVHFATNRHSVDLQKTLDAVQHLPKERILVCDLGHELAGQGGGKWGKIRGALKNLGAFVSLLKLAAYVRSQQIEILHTTDRPRDALLTTLLSRLTGAKSVIHLHIKWSPEIGRAAVMALQHCSGALAISQFVRQSLLDGGIPDSKIYTALNASDPRLFDPLKTERGLLRTKFGLSDDMPLIGIVARIMIWKGHLELVEALALVKRTIPNVRLAIIGKADLLAATSTESYEGKVRQRIAELGLEENVIWAGWFDDTPRVMADLDVLAVPSWEEPFGLVVTEAMAMERPVVGYDSGALPEIVTDGVEGLLVPPKQAEALANALIALLNDPTRRAEMGKAGGKRVLEQFRPARQAEEVTEIYRRILAGQPDTLHAPVARTSQ